jgi:hypothetical protein
VVIPVGEYLPDQPAYSGAGATRVLNMVPRTARSYGPLPSLAVYSGALTARCQGGLFVRDTDASTHGFAGDATKLYKLTAGSTAWSDVSIAAGYSTAADERWSMAFYGRRLIATNWFDPIQSYVIGTSALFANLAAAAPQARYVAVVKDFVMVANTFDATDGNQPQRVWWSGIDDPTSWPTIGSASAAQVQSDRQDLPGDGGWIQGLVGNLEAADGAVFQENAIYRAQYVGSPAIFSFHRIDGARGTPAPGSIASLGPFCFYLADNGFFQFNGAQSVPIGAGKVDRTFWSDVDTSYLYRITSSIDPVNKLVFWGYPGSGNSGGTPNKILVFNWELGRWGYGEQALEILLQSRAFGYTLDQLDPFGTLETLPFPLDSRVWTGNGRFLLSAMDTDHKLATFSGANMAASIDTAEAQIFPGQRAFVSGIKPITDSAAATVAAGTRALLGDSVTYGSDTSMDATGVCPMRSEGRYHRARLSIPATASWSHVSGVDVAARPAGER